MERREKALLLGGVSPCLRSREKGGHREGDSLRGCRGGYRYAEDAALAPFLPVSGIRMTGSTVTGAAVSGHSLSGTAMPGRPPSGVHLTGRSMTGRPMT